MTNSWAKSGVDTVPTPAPKVVLTQVLTHSSLRNRATLGGVNVNWSLRRRPKVSLSPPPSRSQRLWQLLHMLLSLELGAQYIIGSECCSCASLSSLVLSDRSAAQPRPPGLPDQPWPNQPAEPIATAPADCALPTITSPHQPRVGRSCAASSHRAAMTTEAAGVPPQASNQLSHSPSQQRHHRDGQACHQVHHSPIHCQSSRHER